MKARAVVGRREKNSQPSFGRGSELCLGQGGGEKEKESSAEIVEGWGKKTKSVVMNSAL